MYVRLAFWKPSHLSCTHPQAPLKASAQTQTRVSKLRRSQLFSKRSPIKNKTAAEHVACSKNNNNNNKNCFPLRIKVTLHIACLLKCSAVSVWMAFIHKKKVIYLSSLSSGPQDNAWAGELCLLLAYTSGWWSWSVSASSCLCPLPEWRWHAGDKQGLVKLRSCGKVKPLKDGGGQQNSAKTVTSCYQLSIVLCSQHWISEILGT